MENSNRDAVLGVAAVLRVGFFAFLLIFPTLGTVLSIISWATATVVPGIVLQDVQVEYGRPKSIRSSGRGGTPVSQHYIEFDVQYFDASGEKTFTQWRTFEFKDLLIRDAARLKRGASIDVYLSWNNQRTVFPFHTVKGTLLFVLVPVLVIGCARTIGRKRASYLYDRGEIPESVLIWWEKPMFRTFNRVTGHLANLFARFRASI